MAINFSIGDTILIDHSYVQGTLAPRSSTKDRKALLEHLGRLSTGNLLLAKIFPNLPLIRVTRISDNVSKLLRFETEDDLNNSFSFVSNFTTGKSKVVNVQNGTSILIKKGSFVCQTGFTGSNPQKAVVISPKANKIGSSPIFGITIENIFANQSGNVLVEGYYHGFDTRNYSTLASCYVRVENNQAVTIPGGDFHKRGIVINAAPDGTIFLPRQPSGPYDCFESRQYNGFCNNKGSHNLGKAGNAYRRITKAVYADGKSTTFPDRSRPNPRKISNLICAKETDALNSLNATDYTWLWGQFLDHDIALTRDTAEAYPITVPADDTQFTPNSTLPFTRSEYDPSTGTTNVRQQINQQSAYIDASNIYGADTTRAAGLRANDGTGKLYTSTGNLLPRNGIMLDNIPNNHDAQYFIAGDVRANEHLLLTAMHTLWMREHNRIADEIGAANTHLTGDQIYQATRRKVTALVQAITFNEFLPTLLGPGGISAYTGYNENTNPEILNSFATAFYRLGHSMIPSKLLRLDESLQRISLGHTLLRDSFFRPDRLTDGGGIEPLLRGAARQVCQAVSVGTVNELRNFLFASSGLGGQDLAARNIQRGRDHGLPSLNDCRIALGLDPLRSFGDITTDAGVKAKLISVYFSANEIDAWIGALAEDATGGGLVGSTIRRACKLQFEALRDGDRFWYQCMFTGSLLSEINNTKLSDVIRRNTTIGSEIQDNVFIL